MYTTQNLIRIKLLFLFAEGRAYLIPHFNNDNNNNISLFREDNILSIAYLTYGPQQVKQYNYLQYMYIQKD